MSGSFSKRCALRSSFLMSAADGTAGDGNSVPISSGAKFCGFAALQGVAASAGGGFNGFVSLEPAPLCMFQDLR